VQLSNTYSALSCSAVLEHDLAMSGMSVVCLSVRLPHVAVDSKLMSVGSSSFNLWVSLGL